MDHLVDPERSPLVPVLQALQRTLGSCFEGVLHDLSDPEHSLVYIVGGVTGRTVGAPITDLVLRVLRIHGNEAPDLIGYETRTRDGRRLKSTTVFLRDPGGKIVGCLCINLDLTKFDLATSALGELTSTYDADTLLSTEGQAGEGGETFAQTVEEMLAQLVGQVLERAGKPVPMMERDDKIRVVQQLDRRGAFLVRGAVEYVAGMLGVSKYTIYSYLEESRVPKGSSFLR
ncbi:MAG: PAS domain-containing protein [Bacillota bacterium]